MDFEVHIFIVSTLFSMNTLKLSLIMGRARQATISALKNAKLK